MKQWHFYDKVYRRWVVLMVGSYKEFLKEMKDSDYTEMDELRPARGMCVDLNHSNSRQNCNVVWLNKFTLPDLVHELAHLVMYCFNETGVPLSLENTEAFAFYLEYWFNEILAVKKKYPKGRTPAQARR